MKEMNAIQETTGAMIPLLPLRGLVAFPEMMIHFDVGRERSICALERAMQRDHLVFLTAQKDLSVDTPHQDDLFEVGTVCVVRQILKLPGGTMRVMVEGRTRARIVTVEEEEKLMMAAVQPLANVQSRISRQKTQAMIRTLRDRFDEYINYMPNVSSDIVLKVATEEDPGYLSDYITQNVALAYNQKQEVLEELRPIKRMEKITRLLSREIEILSIEADIQEKLRVQIDKSQKEYYLREQLKVIQNELGEGEELSEEVENYHQKITALGLEEEMAEKLHKEADRLLKMQYASAESSVIRTYLDTCLELPWNTYTQDCLRLDTAKKILNAEHYGLDKIKERILEILSVKQLAPQLGGQVLCLVGPPGVGKTSIAKSIAHAMDRKYARISLGGMRDEADIRGHRKTYIGAMPGRIITGIRQAGSKNCVLVLDEIDKMSHDFRGDPASAMLEVLDTEQNVAFRDHFIELPFDLSQVLFITTANDLSTVPRPLLDRMEVIELEGYTEQEKLQIAKRHLFPKQLAKHGMQRNQCQISDAAILQIVRGYTKEAGVRKLEQMLAKICRQCAKRLVEEKREKISVRGKDVEKMLGIPRYKEDAVNRKDEIGLVNGLAWTSVGGEMLEVEVNVMEGTGKVEITGNLGSVMQESARAAITFVRSQARKLDINPMFYQTMDIHIHFPEAAVPKDGPSAGVTIATAVVSALTGAACRCRVAMTGEITLRGRVLPIGGLKEKTMAAYRHGMQTVIIPAENESDLQEIDPVVREKLNFVLAERMDTVLETALDFSAPIKPYIPCKKGESAVLTQ